MTYNNIYEELNITMLIRMKLLNNYNSLFAFFPEALKRSGIVSDQNLGRAVL